MFFFVKTNHKMKQTVDNEQAVTYGSKNSFGKENGIGAVHKGRESWKPGKNQTEREYSVWYKYPTASL